MPGCQLSVCSIVQGMFTPKHPGAQSYRWEADRPAKWKAGTPYKPVSPTSGRVEFVKSNMECDMSKGAVLSQFVRFHESDDFNNRKV